jgi:hypothetical protein
MRPSIYNDLALYRDGKRDKRGDFVEKTRERRQKEQHIKHTEIRHKAFGSSCRSSF